MSANDDDNSQLPSVEGAQSSGLGMSLVDRGKQYSVESVKTLDRIEALRSTYQSMLREVEQIHKSTDLNNYTSVSRSKSRLAQLLGSIEKLQFNQLDAVSTVHLDSGKAEAKSTRRELNAALDDLQDFVTSLHAKYAAVPAPPVLSPSSTTSEEGDGETMGDSGSSEVDERSLHSEGESDSDSDSDCEDANDGDGGSNKEDCDSDGEEKIDSESDDKEVSGGDSKDKKGAEECASVNKSEVECLEETPQVQLEDKSEVTEEESAEAEEARPDKSTVSSSSPVEKRTCARCSNNMDASFLHQWLKLLAEQGQELKQPQDHHHSCDSNHCGGSTEARSPHDLMTQEEQLRRQRQFESQQQRQLQRKRQWELQQQRQRELQQQRQWELQQQRQWELQQQRQWELQQQRQWELQQQRKRQLQRQRQWALQQQRQRERDEQFYFYPNSDILGRFMF